MKTIEQLFTELKDISPVTTQINTAKRLLFTVILKKIIKKQKW